MARKIADVELDRLGLAFPIGMDAVKPKPEFWFDFLTFFGIKEATRIDYCVWDVLRDRLCKIGAGYDFPVL